MKKIKKPKCRCYINSKYNSKTAWRTGKLPKPCPVPGHDEDLKEYSWGLSYRPGREKRDKECLEK